MYHLRNILYVISCIHSKLMDYIEIIHECGKEKIIYDINNFRESLVYVAPEQIHSIYYFYKLQHIINDNITEKDYLMHTWCKEVIDIFMDSSLME